MKKFRAWNLQMRPEDAVCVSTCHADMTFRAFLHVFCFMHTPSMCCPASGIPPGLSSLLLLSPSSPLLCSSYSFPSSSTEGWDNLSLTSLSLPNDGQLSDGADLLFFFFNLWPGGLPCGDLDSGVFTTEDGNKRSYCAWSWSPPNDAALRMFWKFASMWTAATLTFCCPPLFCSPVVFAGHLSERARTAPLRSRTLFDDLTFLLLPLAQEC